MRSHATKIGLFNLNSFAETLVLATMSAVQDVHLSSFALVAPFELTGTEVALLPAHYYSVEVECTSAQFSPFRHPLASNQLLTYRWFSVLPSLLLFQLHH
jgi:hypothetical protein